MNAYTVVWLFFLIGAVIRLHSANKITQGIILGILVSGLVGEIIFSNFYLTLCIMVVLIIASGCLFHVPIILVATSFFGILVLLILPVMKILQSTDIVELIFVAQDPDFLKAVWVSFTAAFIVCVLAIVFGTPMAYLLAREEFPMKDYYEHILTLPIMLPHAVGGIAILSIFGRHGPFGYIFGSVFNTFAGIVLAMGFVSVPIYIREMKESFSMIPRELSDVARTLGAKKIETMFRVELPLTLRSMLSASILTFSRAISEFGAVAVVAFYPTTIAVYVYEQFILYGLSMSRPVSALLILIGLGTFIIAYFMREAKQK